MGKQTLDKRIERILLDAGVKDTDLRARWAKICKDLPEEAEALEAAIGPMPIATLSDVDNPEDAVRYACRDADLTGRVYPILKQRLMAMDLWRTYQMDLACVPCFERMKYIGMHCDPDYFKALDPWLLDQMDEKHREIITASGGWNINPGSGEQTAAMLLACGVPLTKMTKGGEKTPPRESTNDKILESFADDFPLARLVCDWRELAKLRNSFCITLPRYVDENNRIHADFKLTRVATGRLATADPNLLGIPVRTELGKKIREGFPAPNGHVLGSWDLDQIEMRVMADESRDEALCEWFNTGLDVHRMTAAEILGKNPEDVTVMERAAGKTAGFGTIFVISGIGLSAQARKMGMKWADEDGERYLSEYYALHPGVKAYQEECFAEARRYGYARDRWGRIRYLPGVWSDIKGIREEAERQSVAQKIQAGAVGISKRAIAAMWEFWKSVHQEFWLEPLIWIHDEVMWETEENPEHQDTWEQIVLHCLTRTTKMRVPIKAKGSYGRNWGSLKD